MSKFYVEMGFIASDYGTEEALDKHLDCVLDALHDDDRAIDPDYSATLTTGHCEFSMSVEAVNDVRALGLVLLIMRTAAHTADLCTPGWEAHFKRIQTMIREVEGADLVIA